MEEEIAEGYIERVEAASPETHHNHVDKDKCVASSSTHSQTEMPSHSQEDMQLKLDQALQSIEFLKQRVDEAHNKYDTLLELFQAYIQKDYDKAASNPEQRKKVRSVNRLEIDNHLTTNLQVSEGSTTTGQTKEQHQSNENIHVSICCFKILLTICKFVNYFGMRVL